MAASYPNAAPTFTPLVDGVDYPQADDLQVVYDEVAAMGAAAVSGGFAHDLDPDSTAGNRDLGSTSKEWRQLHAKLLNVADASELTVATGAITVTQSYHKVDTEADAASDDLDTITAGTGLGAGAVLILRAENVARVVTLKDGTGNLLLNGDCALSATDRTISLLYDGTNWREVGRSAPRATLLAADDTQVTTSTGAETLLYTYTIPANALTVTGQTIRLRAVGTLAGDTDSKAIKVRLGGIAGTTIVTVSQNGSTLVNWMVEVLVTRTGLNTQRLWGRGEYGISGTGASQVALGLTTGAETETAAIDLVVTGTGVNAGDIVYEAAWVETVQP